MDIVRGRLGRLRDVRVSLLLALEEGCVAAVVGCNVSSLSNMALIMAALLAGVGAAAGSTAGSGLRSGDVSFGRSESTYLLGTFFARVGRDADNAFSRGMMMKPGIMWKR